LRNITKLKKIIMADKNFNLVANLVLNAEKFNSQINSAKTNVNNGGKSMMSSLSGIASKFSGVIAASGLTVAAMSTFRGAIETTQAAGDAWAVTISGAKGALEGFYRTVGTGDWGNFMENMKNGKIAAEELTVALDELFEKGLSRDIQNSGIDLKIAELERDLKVAKAQGNNKLVISIGAEVEGLRKDKLDNELKVAGDTLEAYMRDMESKTKLSRDSIMKYLTNYINSDELNRQAAEYQEAINKIDGMQGNAMSTSAGIVYTKVSDSVKAAAKAKVDAQYSEEVRLQAATKELYDRTNEEVTANAINAAVAINKIKEQIVKEGSRTEVAVARATNNEVKNNILKTDFSIKLSIDIENAEKDLKELEANLEKIEDPEVKIDFVYYGLPKLERELDRLEEKLKFSSTKESYANTSKEIEALRRKIADFKGEVIDTKIAFNWGELSGVFNTLADAAERFGDKTIAGMLNVASATSQAIEAISKLINTLTTLTTAQQASSAVQAANIPSLRESVELIKSLGTEYTTTLGQLQQMSGLDDKSFAEQMLGSQSDASGIIAGIEGISDATQAASSASIASAPLEIAANQGKALSGAAASGAAMPFPANIIAIAAGIAAVVAAFSNIAKFETGGIVGGTSYSGDKILARLNSGEMILNQSQQAGLYNQLNATSQTDREVTFKIDGTSLVGVLNNYNKRLNSFR
jgi:hypothetical protein